MSIRTKLFIYINLTIFVIFVVSLGFINYENLKTTIKNSERVSDMYAKYIALQAQNILMSDMKIVEALAQIMKSYSLFDHQTREKVYNQALKDILENNPQFLATWVSWELKAIDPKWRYDYGRVRYIVFMNRGRMTITKDSVNLDGDQPGSMYYLMKTGVEKTLLSNPYFFSYTKDTSSSFLETSIGIPIKLGDRFVGAVGIDVSLERFQDLLKEIKPFAQSQIVIVSNDGTIIAHPDNRFMGKPILKIYPDFAKFNTIENIRSGFPFSFRNKTKFQRFTEYISFYPIKLPESTMPWSIGFIVPEKVIREQIGSNIYLLFVISIISLFLVSIISTLFLLVTLRPLKDITNALEALSKGVISENIKTKYKSNDELGMMSHYINDLIDSLNNTQNFALEIGRGNLDVTFKNLSQTNILGKTLVEMRDNLLKARIEQEERKKEDQKVNWIQSGINQVNEILRENSDNLESLTREIIKFLVKFSNAQIGGFYLIEKEDEDYEVIKLKASYAYDRFKELKSEFLVGEGLVGRVVKERKHTIIEDLPEGYMFVRSGLGDKSPKHLIIIPLMFENTILGAIEIASFYKFEDYVVNFLLEIVSRITSSLSVMLKNIETSNLLKESQLQTATFEMKEKQFIRQRQNLKEKQKELETKEAQLGAIFEAMKLLGNYIEIDTNYQILDLNEFLPKNFSMSKQDFIGKDIRNITQQIKGTKVWYEKFWEDVYNGLVRKKQTVYSINNKELSVNETFFRFTDKEITKIIIIGL